MNEDTNPIAAPNDALDAFEELRQSVAMVHAAVLGLTAVREKMPDYSDTLRAMQQHLDDIDERFAKIAAKPALQLTPAVMADEFGKRAVEVRAEDRMLLAEARKELARVVGELETQTRNVAAFVPRAIASEAQKERQLHFGVAGLVSGILLWSFLPGAVARSLPESWGVPQWMADRTLGGSACGVGATKDCGRKE